ncbi:hypothetical protein [Paractinoplanes brasiliensis]|uniref:hypothetical protein n=1 Tax=Paractinoplanes brasiliensis TaxID=52695 RepID=UPI00105F20D8|nr:hypothetical protein [Actinoplanes brasiliensis]GID29951.1 hypothetical protein Abr02nite_49340 [Actinoplanes brasiliensis]
MPEIHALDGGLSTAEPKRLRYHLLHTARLTTANVAAATHSRERALGVPTLYCVNPDHGTKLTSA